MKKSLHIILPIISIIAVYLAVSFVKMDIDASNWTEKIRTDVIFIGIIFMVIGAILAHAINDN